jgi:F-type H+-transporting ATPase subunit gamma
MMFRGAHRSAPAKQAHSVPSSCLDGPVGAKRGFPGKGRLAQLGARRRTVKTIEKITGTMKMVAQAQLAKDSVKANKTKQCYFNLNPMYKKLPEQANKRTMTILITSNRGLCGPLNNQLVRDVCTRPDYNSTSVFAIGDKGAQAVEKRPGDNERVWASAHPGPSGLTFSEIGVIADKICAKSDTYDEIKIVFNQFVSQNTFSINEITIPSGASLIANKKVIDFDFDENYKEMLANFHEYHVANAINYTFNQNSASETLSRRNAMDSASKNCKELKKKINIEFNKLRQAIITTELIEVTTGAVAAEEMA